MKLDAHILLYQNQNEMRGSMDRNHDELKELMYKILQDNRELLRVVEMEKAGEHVAEALMEAGQTVCRTHSYCSVTYLSPHCFAATARYTGTTGDWCRPH